MIIELVDLLFGLTMLLAGTTAFIFGIAYAFGAGARWGDRHRERSLAREASRMLYRENLKPADDGIEIIDR